MQDKLQLWHCLNVNKSLACLFEKWIQGKQVLRCWWGFRLSRISHFLLVPWSPNLAPLSQGWDIRLNYHAGLGSCEKVRDSEASIHFFGEFSCQWVTLSCFWSRGLGRHNDRVICGREPNQFKKKAVSLVLLLWSWGLSFWEYEFSVYPRLKRFSIWSEAYTALSN